MKNILEGETNNPREDFGSKGANRKASLFNKPDQYAVNQ
jgi:hypothetical protein